MTVPHLRNLFIGSALLGTTIGLTVKYRWMIAPVGSTLVLVGLYVFSYLGRVWISKRDGRLDHELRKVGL